MRGHLHTFSQNTGYFFFPAISHAGNLNHDISLKVSPTSALTAGTDTCR